MWTYNIKQSWAIVVSCCLLVCGQARSAIAADANDTSNREILQSTATASRPMILALDASEISRGIVFSHMQIPVNAGPITLVYPKWIPGEHAPTGPLNNMSMLRISTAAGPLPWQRDLVDMYAFHTTVPAGVSTLSVDMDVLLNSTDDTVATANLGIVQWNRFLLYQAGTNVSDVYVKPSIQLPRDWNYATALQESVRAGSRAEFGEVNLATLVDSPLDCGKYSRRITLWRSGGAFNELDLFADKPQDLEISAQTLAEYKRLVPQTLYMYRARHWRNYHFLLTLSDAIPENGIEHHESSDNRAAADFLSNKDRAFSSGDLLPHEFSHSWNGKFRRPADLTTIDYQMPQKTDLLWIYEGLNQYLGDVLSFRSGIRDRNSFADFLASDYAAMAAEPGRERDPLADVAAAAPYLGLPGEGDYPSLRRGFGDFYAEGELIWLDADTIILERSGGKKSLTDFLQLYAGPPDTGPIVRTYTLEDIESLLERVQHYPWHDFFQRTVYEIATNPPSDEFQRAGWQFVYNSTPNEYDSRDDDLREHIDAWYSLGLALSSDGEIRDVRADSAAWQARLAPHMQILAINHQEFSKEILDHALTSAQRDRKPLEMLVKQNHWFQTYTINYTLGPRHPHLVRIPHAPDLLAKIVAPLHQ